MTKNTSSIGIHYSWMIDMTDDIDPLTAFNNLSICPSCATLSVIGTPRCPECGAFHMTIQDADERIPQSNRINPEPVDNPLNPEFYSMDPRGDIPEEHFPADEDVVTDWDGSSVDFALEDDS